MHVGLRALQHHGLVHQVPVAKIESSIRKGVLAVVQLQRLGGRFTVRHDLRLAMRLTHLPEAFVEEM